MKALMVVALLMTGCPRDVTKPDWWKASGTHLGRNEALADGSTGTKDHAQIVPLANAMCPTIRADATTYKKLSDAKVLVGDLTGSIHAINAETGTDGVWDNIGGGINTCIAAPFGDPQVYVATTTGELLALSGSAGSVIWRHNLNTDYSVGANEYQSPSSTTPYDDVLYLTAKSYLLAVKTSGEKLWLKKLDAEVAAGQSPIVVTNPAHGVVVVVATTAGTVYEFEAKTGRESVPSKNFRGEDFRGSAAVGSDLTLYFTSQSGRLLGLDVTDLSVRWTFDTGVPGPLTGVAINTAGKHGDVVHFASDTILYAVETPPKSAAQLKQMVEAWRFGLELPPHTNLVVTPGGVVYLGTAKSVAVGESEIIAVAKEGYRWRYKTDRALPRGLASGPSGYLYVVLDKAFFILK